MGHLLFLLLLFPSIGMGQFGFGGLDVGKGYVSSAVNQVSQVKNISVATGCFTNEHGYKCCSRILQTFLTVTFKVPLVEQLLDTLDLQKSVNSILGMVQDEFGTSFEIVLSPRDFASKNTFRGDLMFPYSTALGENRPLTDNEIEQKGWGASFSKVSSLAFGS